MNLQNAVKSGFNNYVTFSGRACRSEFWYWNLFGMLITIVAVILDIVTGIGLIQSLVSLVLFLPGLSVIVRRLHDVNRRGWWFFLILIPLIGAIIIFYWQIKKGDNGDNRFGPDPLGGTGTATSTTSGKALAAIIIGVVLIMCAGIGVAMWKAHSFLHKVNDADSETFAKNIVTDAAANWDVNTITPYLDKLYSVAWVKSVPGEPASKGSEMLTKPSNAADLANVFNSAKNNLGKLNSLLGLSTCLKDEGSVNCVIPGLFQNQAAAITLMLVPDFSGNKYKIKSFVIVSESDALPPMAAAPATAAPAASPQQPQAQQQAQQQPAAPQPNKAGGFKIDLRDTTDLNFKTKAQIYGLRKALVMKNPELAPANYEPSNDVFGGIQDGKPWWGVLGKAYYGDGQKSIEGNADQSRFIDNPFMLIGLDLGDSLRITTPNIKPEPIYPVPLAMGWSADHKQAVIRFDVTSVWEKQFRINDPNLHKFNMIAYNARDMGYNYLAISSDKSTNVTSLALENPVKILQYIHTGNSCGYPGGCNNVSPYQKELDINISKLPARLYIKLWKQQPQNTATPEDMLYIIDMI